MPPPHTCDMTYALFLFLPLVLSVPAVGGRHDATVRTRSVGGKGGPTSAAFSPRAAISNETDAKGPKVVTTGGQECALPFRQGGQIHHGCVSVLAPRPWCSLTPNFDRDRQWGFCAPEPRPPDEGSQWAGAAVSFRLSRRMDDPCRGRPCQNGGRCEAASAECSCPEGFSGRFCQHQRCYESVHLRHYDAGESWGRIHLRNVEQCTCGGGGNGEVQCRPTRYTACSANPCQNEGRCRTIATTGEKVCHCRRGYGGPRCSLEPESRCYEGRGAAYRGLASTAASGAPCLPWDSELLYDELHLGTVRGAALKGLGEHAYCRNPDGDKKPWCYTLSQGAISWEYCAVPPCKGPAVSSRRTKAANPTCGKKHKKRPAAAVRARIMGGSAALPGAHPWMAAIYIRAGDFCAGTLIASCWVLSAAHCFLRNPLKREIRVVLGQNLFNVSGTETRAFGVDKLVFHERFSVFNPTRHDIVLIKLKKQKGRCVKRTPFIEPICLPDGGVAFPDDYCCSISGWGHVHEDDHRYSNLREAGVRLIRHEDCRKPEVYGNHVTADMICAGLRGCADACQGDSGGPLACAKDGVHFLYGIVSWGDGCGRSGKPGVYTRVANYLDWINSVIRRTPPKT
ncbi:hepatocyte growth factor activator serine protease [Stigmatopora argus]